MLINHKAKTILITPPKTGSTSIHTLGQQMGMTVVYGPQGDDPDDFPVGLHTSFIPHMVEDYQRFVVYRNPYDRLVSCWFEWCRFFLYRGESAISFEHFARRILAGKESWFHRFTTSQIVGEQDLHGQVRFAHLESDLTKHFFRQDKSVKLEILRQSHRQKWKHYYSRELLRDIRQWATEDIRRWGTESDGSG